MSGGESNYVVFGYETTFKTGVTCNKLFGENTTLRTVDLKNNIKRLLRLGGRNAANFVAGKFEGALSIEFDIADPWFLRGVLGSVASSGAGPGPYYHTFSEAVKPPSLTVENGIGLNGNTSSQIRTYLGCVIGDCKISAAVGDEPAKGSLTLLYADESLNTSGYSAGMISGVLSSGIVSVDYVYPFTNGTFDYPTGTSIADTESVELSITNTAALKHALGSRKASRYDMRQRTYDVTTTHLFNDPTTYLTKAYGGSAAPNATMVSGEAGCRITLDNGGTSSQIRKWQITLTKTIIERHGSPQAVEQENMETVDIMGQSANIIVTNATSVMP